ncbi:FCD domain-containing protein [Pseudovibrio exalbescens]|uniref:FCD domain-containing protein n=1 Tax=Pseudovibrio exalbescens TaxID=197461 RepID=UPI001F1B0229|nr:FCD domain-containing protein [Pseudovibrio exalbescens]
MSDQAEKVVGKDEGVRASEAMARMLIHEIKLGALSVGDPLPTERELCERFNASRPTVREAIAQMQMSGYATSGGGKRPRADKPTVGKIIVSAADHIREALGDAEGGAQLEQLRQFLECGAIREATRKANNMSIAKIKQALDANYAAIGTEDFGRTDIAFHRSILSVVGNALILALHDNFVDLMLSHRPQHTDQLAHDQVVYEEHREMYEAILAGDAGRASDILDRHLERSYRSRLSPPSKAIVKGADDETSG